MRQVRPLRGLWFLAATFIAAAVLTPTVGVAAPAQQTTLNISSQADLISGSQILVYVTVQGTGGPGSVFVNVVQARPPFFGIIGNGFAQILCDGRRRTYAVSVFGFSGNVQLGEAEAFANANCPTSGSAAATQTIRITKP